MLRINCCVFYISYIITTQYLNKKKFLGTNKWFHACLKSNAIILTGFHSRQDESNCFPSKLCPKFHSLGATLYDVTVSPSLAVTSNDKAWFFKSAFMCQFWPQFRPIGSQPVLDPLIFTATISPDPATFRIRTEMNRPEPSTVKRIPPSLRHFSLPNPINNYIISISHAFESTG